MGATLKQATAAFDQWHAINNRRGHVDDSLKDLALSLLDRHSPTEISKALGISTTSLRNWQRSKLSSDAPTFVNLPIPELNPSPVNSSMITLTIKLSHEIEIIVSKQSISETTKLICTLVKEFEK